MKIQKFKINVRSTHALIGGSFCTQHLNYTVAATSRQNLDWFFETYIKPTFDGIKNKLESFSFEIMPDSYRCHHWTKSAQFLLQDAPIDKRISNRI